MKKLLATTAFVALMAASGSAFADNTVGSQITMKGTSVPTCTVTENGTAHTIGDNWEINGLINGHTVDTTPVVESNIGTVSCNYAAHAGLKTQNGAMTSGLTAVSGFDNMVTYKATLGWAGMSPITLTAGGVVNLVNADDAGPRAGVVELTISPDSNANPLLAGAYQDVLVVQIGNAL